MTIKNAYPELPVVPYMKTKVGMPLVVAYLQKLDEFPEVKRAAYIFFRIESANGSKGVNNNYAGVQADGARWPGEYDRLFKATTVLPENGTNKPRRFLVFDTWEDSVNFTVENVARRGMYIGGQTWKVSTLKVNSITDLLTAYKREWVTGNSKYTIKPDELAPFVSMYTQAKKLFPDMGNA